MAITNEITELRAELATLAGKVATLELQLKVEREIAVIARKKTAHCRVCQDKPESAEGHPQITDLERQFCERGHRFKTLTPDQLRTQRGW